VSFFLQFVAYQPHQLCQISFANNQQVENLKAMGALFFALKVSNPSTPWFMLYLLRFCSFQNSNLPMFRMSVPFREVFFLLNMLPYQPLQRCQILCANKQQFEKLQTLAQSLLLGKI